MFSIAARAGEMHYSMSQHLQPSWQWFNLLILTRLLIHLFWHQVDMLSINRDWCILQLIYNESAGLIQVWNIPWLIHLTMLKY